jgi:predicted nucleic acid-binding protein
MDKKQSFLINCIWPGAKAGVDNPENEVKKKCRKKKFTEKKFHGIARLIFAY